MNRILSVLFFFCLLTGVLAACRKKDPSPASSSKSAFLVKTWQVAKVSQNGISMPLYQRPLPAGEYIVEDYSRYQLTFSSTETYTLLDKDGSFRSGSWELASDNTRLVLDKGVSGKEWIANISEISEKTLKLRYTENSTKTGNRDLLLELIAQ